MTDYEINHILRMLAQLCYSKLSSDSNMTETYDYASYSRESRLYECYQDLCRNAKGIVASETMLKNDFLSKFATIEYHTSLKVVDNLNADIKEGIAYCILYILKTEISCSALLYKNDLRIVEDIISHTHMTNQDLQRIISHSKTLELY